MSASSYNQHYHDDVLFSLLLFT